MSQGVAVATTASSKRRKEGDIVILQPDVRETAQIPYQKEMRRR